MKNIGPLSLLAMSFSAVGFSALKPNHRPKITVVFPTDKSNVNAVGNVVSCMVNAVFEDWEKRGHDFEYEAFNDQRDANQAAIVAEAIAKGAFDVAIGTTFSSQAIIVRERRKIRHRSIPAEIPSLVTAD